MEGLINSEGRDVASVLIARYVPSPHNKIMKQITLLILAFALLACQVTAQCDPGEFDDGTGANCQPCPDNTYNLNGNGTECEICTLCTNCEAATGDCTACNPGNEPIGTDCNPCGNNSYSAGLGPCQLCMGCAACEAANGNCTACTTGYSLNATSKTCQIDCSVPGCQTCNDPDVCAVCSTNFTLQVSNNTCVDNCGIDLCVECSGTTCSLCLENYILFGSSCVVLCDIDNCLTCVEDAYDECEVCSTGFSLTTDETACVVCNIPDCNSCNYFGLCDNCAGDLEFQNGQCLTCYVDNCDSCSANNECASSGCYPSYSFNSDSTSTSDQCVSCDDPCATCYSDGSCQTCDYPYSQLTLTQGSSCFFCADARCTSCSSIDVGACTVCAARYVLSAGACESVCATGCSICANSTVCATCNSMFYYMGANSTCVQCPNAPACMSCNASMPMMCTQCATGYWLNSTGACLPCQAYCQQCTSSMWCTVLVNSIGNTLIAVSKIANVPAACDPGCEYCSSSNPQLCTDCLDGYYLKASTFDYCAPCTFASFCSSCSATDPTICLTCFSGFFLNSSSVCVQCAFPCVSCAAQNATQCSACAQGYVLASINSTCILSSSASLSSFGLTIENCANSQLTTATNGSNTLACNLCNQGYAPTTGGCAPCTMGCRVCNPNSLVTCTTCMAGYYLNATNVCVACASNCQVCSPFGNCLSCANYYVLNQNFVCQLPCMTPCATCSATNPNQCVSCLIGYSLVSGQCSPSTSCNPSANCLACPYGTTVTTSSTKVRLNQTCVACSPASNCARCNLTSPAQCYSCDFGMYLASTVCQACTSSCASCISLNMCTMCATGFLPQQTGGLLGNSATGLVNCTTCTSNCATCLSSASTCTSCNSGFKFSAGICVSTFSFRVTVILGVSLPVFSNNYLNFLNQIASAASVTTKNILILSITEGSVNVAMQVNSPSSSGSNAATTAQNNLNNLLVQGANVANMGITSSSVTTDDSSPSDDDGGLSTRTIIILAVVIPVGILLIVAIIVIIYCVHKRRREQEAGMNEWNSNNTTGRNIELSSNEPKRAYL